MAYLKNNFLEDENKHPKKPNLALLYFVLITFVVCIIVVTSIISKSNAKKAFEKLREAQEKDQIANSTHSPTPYLNTSSIDGLAPSDNWWSITNTSTPMVTIKNTPVSTLNPSLNQTSNPTNTPVPDNDLDFPQNIFPSSTDAPTPTPLVAFATTATPEPTAAPTAIPTEVPTPEPTSAPTATPRVVPAGYHYEYYKSLLPESVQAAYDEYLLGIANFQSNIPVHITDDSFNDLMTAIRNDHPELFWMGSHISYTTYNNSPGVRFITPSYYFNSEESVPCQNVIDSLSQYFVSSTSGQSTYQKIKTVYEYIICSTVYGHGTYDQECYSVFMENRSVCAGYSAAFKVLMDHLEIPCIIVSGNNSNHAWNMVYLDNNWYHIDVTWGDPTCSDGKQRLTYEYFLLSDNEILRSHSFDNDFALPQAPISCAQKSGDDLKKRLTS